MNAKKITQFTLCVTWWNWMKIMRTITFWTIRLFYDPLVWFMVYQRLPIHTYLYNIGCEFRKIESGDEIVIKRYVKNISFFYIVCIYEIAFTTNTVWIQIFTIRRSIRRVYTMLPIIFDEFICSLLTKNRPKSIEISLIR